MFFELSFLNDYLTGFQYSYTVNNEGYVPDDPGNTDPPIDGTDPVIDPPVEANRSGQQLASMNMASQPTLQFFPTAEGYYDDIYKKYVYQYKDHLGNVRVSYAKNPVTQVLEIIEENNYYPFGLKHTRYNDYVASNNKYKYNGKELQDELGLNFYDYGARNYDPAIGRWMNIDPLAEKSRRWSPYNYAYNNPISFVDPDGMLSQSFMKELWNKSGNGETKWTNDNNGTFSADNGATVNAKEDDDTYTVDKNGNVNRVDEKKYKGKDGREVDRLIALDGKGKRTSTTMDVDAGIINGGTGGEKGTSKFGGYKYYFGKNNANMKQLFTFLAYNTNVEWSIVTSSKESYIATAQKTDIEFGGISLLTGFLQENGTIKYTYTHSHPNGYSLTPSGFDGKDNSHGGNDMKVKAFFNKWYPGRVTNYIYHMGNTVKF